MNYIAVLFKPPKDFRDFGAQYSPEWVNKLYRNLKRWSPDATLTVITDFEDGFLPEIIKHPFVLEDSGWMKLMEMYRPDLVGERSILVGLDNIFVGDLSDIERCNDEIILPRDPFYPQHICNAVVSISGDLSNKLWEQWLITRKTDMNNQKYKLDGQWSEMFWLRDQLKKVSYWDDLLPNKIVSYKVQCKNGIPSGKASIVYFHGNPKQHNLLHKDWVKKNWI
jgi:hypothetical protein